MLATTTVDAILIQDKGVVLDCNLSSAEDVRLCPQRGPRAYGAFLVITMN